MNNKYLKINSFKEAKDNGFAIPQILILGIGVAVALSGLMAASILNLTGSRFSRQELMAKAASESGVTTIRNFFNDSGNSFLHYFWLSDSCSESGTNCPTNVSANTIPNPPKEYWSDDQWCEGDNSCKGRQKAPMCSSTSSIDWENSYKIAFTDYMDDIPERVGSDLLGAERQFNQTFNIKSTDYTGTEKSGINSIVVEGYATAKSSSKNTAFNKLRVNIQVNKETPYSGFGFLGVGETEADGNGSLFLGNLSFTSSDDIKAGSIIWRRNLKDQTICGDFVNETGLTDSSTLPNSSLGNGGIWIQPIALPKQPRLSNVKDLDILVCTPVVIQRDGTNCKLGQDLTSNQTFRIDSLFATGPGSSFEVSTSDESKVILEIMGDLDISNEGIFCHRNATDACGTGKPQNLTILFKQKTKQTGNEISCNRFSGGLDLIKGVPIDLNSFDNDFLPNNSFLIDNTGSTQNDQFRAFVYGPETTFFSEIPKSSWVQSLSNNSEWAPMIVTTRGTYGWIRNTLGTTQRDKMTNIIITESGELIPYLDTSDDSLKVEIIGIGNRINPFPVGSTMNSDNVFLIYDSNPTLGSTSYYLRGFDVVDNLNPHSTNSSQYSYPGAAAILKNKTVSNHVNLGDVLDLTDGSETKNWLEVYNINVQERNTNHYRNFAGAAWAKNICFDTGQEITWDFSKEFIDGLVDWHGPDFNWGVSKYRGRSIILWDTLREFSSSS